MSPDGAARRMNADRSPIAAFRGSRTLWLLWLLAFCIPWGDMVLLPGDIQASRLLTLVAFMVAIPQLIRSRRFRTPTSTELVMLVFVVWAAADVFWTLEPDRSVRRVLSYAQLSFNAWLFYQFVRGTEDYRRILQAYVLGSYVAFAGLIFNFVSGVAQGDGRYTAPGFDPNDLAATLALGIPIAWYLVFTGGGARWLNRLYVPCALTAVLLTASRSGLVTLAVSMMFPLLAMPRISMRAKIALVLVALFCAGSYFYFLSDVSVRRLSTIVDQLSGGDMNGRVDIWQRGFDVFEENPILGVGGGAFGATVVGRSGAEVAAHNTFLGVLVEHGLVGLLLFLGIISGLVRRSLRSPSLECRLWTVVLAAWIVALFSLSWENRELTWLLWGLCSAQPWRRGFPGRAPLGFRRTVYA